MTSARPSRFATAVASPPKALKLPAESVAIPRDLLDGGELVILAIKPSAWYVLFEPLRWLAVGVLLLLCVPWATRVLTLGMSPQVMIEIILGALAARVLVAILRWVSRFYVLTNRRVMWVRGVLRPAVWGCPLVRVRNTRLSADLHERLVKLGSLEFVTEELPPGDCYWRFIARSEEVHAEVRRAIMRAIDNQPSA